MCTTLGRALCWCWFLMLSLHVIAIDVFFKLWKCDTDQGWWILKAVIQVKVQHHSHVWVLGTISNPRGDVVRSPTSPIRTSLTLVEIAEGTRCSVVLVAWFLQFVHAAFWGNLLCRRTWASHRTFKGSLDFPTSLFASLVADLFVG